MLHHSPTTKMLETLCCRGSRKASCSDFVSAMKYLCVCVCLHVFVCLCVCHTAQVLSPRIILILIFGHQIYSLFLSICHTLLYFHPLYFLGEQSSNALLGNGQCIITLTPPQKLPQDPSSVMEITLKSNRFLIANIKAVKQFSEFSWTSDCK